MVYNGRLRVSPKNTWLRVYREVGEMWDYIELDYIIYVDEKLRTYEER